MTVRCDCDGKGCDEEAGFHCERHCPNFACDRRSRRSPACTGNAVSIVACECGKEYRRCEGHGGEAGARRSLHSHVGLTHPTPSGGLVPGGSK